MNRNRFGQAGGSAFGTILTLLVLGYGVFVGIQWVPHLIESKSIDSVLDSLQEGQQGNPASSTHEVRERLDYLLNVNEMDDMAKQFTVRQDRGSIIVEIEYERTLNLIFEERPFKYRKSKTLR